MIFRITSDKLKVNNFIKDALKPGDLVTLNVIKQLTDGKWAVSIKGKVIPARSDVELVPGSSIKAQILSSGDRLVLKIMKDNPRPIQQLLSGLGIAQDGVCEAIVTSLVASDLKVTQEIVTKIRKTMERMKKDDIKSARILALILSKNIDISNPNIDELFQLLSYGNSAGNGEQKEKHRENGEREPGEKKRIKKAVMRTSENPDNLLQVFNHLNGDPNNWIVIPFSFDEQGEDFEGAIRVLYNTKTRKTEKVVLSISVSGNPVFSFFMHPANDTISVKMFSADPDFDASHNENFRDLTIKLQNKGAKIDDIVYNEEDFDGFTPSADVFPYKTIDTLT